MLDSELKDSEVKAAAEQPLSPRRPYVPPAIEETSAFETLALACTKGNALQCGDYYNPDQYHGS